jgi:hypothetical protein
MPVMKIGIMLMSVFVRFVFMNMRMSGPWLNSFRMDVVMMTILVSMHMNMYHSFMIMGMSV